MVSAVTATPSSTINNTHNDKYAPKQTVQSEQPNIKNTHANTFSTQSKEDASTKTLSPSQLETNKESQESKNTQINNVYDCYDVGLMFVDQYYNVMCSQIQSMHKFYATNSQVIVEYKDAPVDRTSKTLVGQKEIHEEYDRVFSISNSKKRLPFIVNVEHMDAMPTINEGILIHVNGYMQLEEDSRKETKNNIVCFNQVFVLAQQPNGYYVLNDIIKYKGDPSNLVINKNYEEEIKTQEHINVKNVSKVETPDFAENNNDTNLENDFKPAKDVQNKSNEADDFGQVDAENNNNHKTEINNKTQTENTQQSPDLEKDNTSRSWANLAKKNHDKWGGLKSDVIQGTTKVVINPNTENITSNKKEVSSSIKSKPGQGAQSSFNSRESNYKERPNTKDSTNSVFIKSIDKDALNYEVIKSILQDELGSKNSVVDIKIIFNKNAAIAKLESSDYVDRILKKRDIKSADNKYALQCFVYKPSYNNDERDFSSGGRGRGTHARNTNEYRRGPNSNSSASNRSGSGFGHRKLNPAFNNKSSSSQGQIQGNRKTNQNDQQQN